MGISLWLGCLNLSLDLSCHSCECVFNVKWFFGWCFQESNIKMISEFFCLLIWHLSLIFKIFFVSNENPRDIFWSMLVNLRHPFRDLGEWITIVNTISYYDTVSTFIITASDGFKSLLTGSIPNLEFNGLSIHINGSNFEVNTNCRHEIIIEYIIL